MSTKATSKANSNKSSNSAASSATTAKQLAAAARTKANAGVTAQPGIIASIMQQLVAAKTAKQPVTAQQIIAALAKQFPQRSATGMQVTVRAQLSRLPNEKDFAIAKQREGRVVKYSAA